MACAFNECKSQAVLIVVETEVCVPEILDLHYLPQEL